MPTVLITGANRGLGLEYVRQYLEQGWQVHACTRKPDAPELTSLDQTNLENAYLYRTDLRGVDLSKTIGLSQVQLRGSCGDKDTKLPPDLQTPGEWPCELEPKKE